MALATLDSSVYQFWQPKGIGVDPPSTSHRTVTLRVQGTDEVISVPLYTNTKVAEVKALLELKLGVDSGSLTFTYRQGAHYRRNLDVEEVAKNVVVSGIKSFTRATHQWQYPHCIIGAGHLGLKVAMTWLMDGYTNFILFDRRPEVGGTSWWQQANTTSRLQTEMGVYHLEYHEKNGWPDWSTDQPWPSRDQLLEHFKETSERFGILPYCRMNTDVTKMNVISTKDYWQQHYEVTLCKDSEESVMQVASICFFPGNLTIPKRVVYKGEEVYGGHIVYGICSEFDYSQVRGKQVSIIGSGAFAVENVRTCVEYAATKIYMICRRKTISMPRVVSWLINQSVMHISAAQTVEAMSPMYDLIGVDQWGYYSIFANEAKTTVNIRQKSRFGIGDVYFLTMYCGMCDHIVDDVKRLSYHKIHLISGRTIEDVPIMLKLLGFNGEFANDRLLKIKELYGWWVNRDFRRYIVAEPLGVDANNFGGTSFSPGAIAWSEQHVYLMKYPKDFSPVMDSGQMPMHVADESIDRPAYVVEARHGSITGITLGALVPGLAERNAVTAPLKHQRMWQIHPADKYLAACRREWEAWGRQIWDAGYTEKEIPPYPYTIEHIERYLEKEKETYRELARRAGGR